MSKIKLYKKNFGGGIQGIAQMGSFGMGLLQESNNQANEHGYRANEGQNALAGTFSGAAQGASMGSALGPIGTVAGAGIGALVGGIGAYKRNQAAYNATYAADREKDKNYLSGQQEKYNQLLANGFNTQGNTEAQKYMKKGGLLYHSMKNGGVEPLSKSNVLFKGNSHEQGGVKEPVVHGTPLQGVEVEGGETMSTSNGQKFVFSEALGFAQKHKPLAKAIGKIEAKLKDNPHDQISTRTLSTLKEREEALKLKQELYKESLGIPNDSVNLKNGGFAKYPLGGIPYRNTVTDDMFQPGPNIGSFLSGQGNLNPIASLQPASPQLELNRSISVGQGAGDFSGMGSDKFSTSRPSPGFNFGNALSKVVPYAGAMSNLILNKQAKNIATPKEALPDLVQYKPIDLTNQKVEADMQRRELNQNLTSNVSNSAVAAALKAKNLGTTMRQKNAINQQESNINHEGLNRTNLINNQIQQTRNRIDVENRDRDYDRDQRFITNQGKILNNFSEIYQQQNRDGRLYDLENRKLDTLKDLDFKRGIHDLYLKEQIAKQKNAYKLGGKVKKTSLLYNKSKK